MIKPVTSAVTVGLGIVLVAAATGHTSGGDGTGYHCGEGLESTKLKSGRPKRRNHSDGFDLSRLYVSNGVLGL